MSTADGFPADGGCTCGEVRYRMTTRPLFVHCCHCRWCQRETGASFALNAMIEADRVELLKGAVRGRRHAVKQRQGPEDHRAVRAAASRCGATTRSGRHGALRSRRHARSAGPAAARHSHLHCLQAALGGPAARRPCRRGVLREGVYWPARAWIAAECCWHRCSVSYGATSASVPFATSVRRGARWIPGESDYTFCGFVCASCPGVIQTPRTSAAASYLVRQLGAAPASTVCIGQRCSTNTMGEDG